MSLDASRRERIQARMQRMIDGLGLDVAFQPIVDLASGRVVCAEALARFTDAAGHAIPTERCFLDAHAVDMGVELELAVIRRALECHSERLPSGRYLALNVSPAVLEQDELVYILQGHPTLHTDEGRTQLSPGMCAGFRKGTGNGHHLVNETREDVIYLEVGDRTPGDEGSYPDDDIKAMLVDGSWRFVHKDGSPY